MVTAKKSLAYTSLPHLVRRGHPFSHQTTVEQCVHRRIHTLSFQASTFFMVSLFSLQVNCHKAAFFRFLLKKNNNDATHSTLKILKDYLREGGGGGSVES